MLIFQNQDLSRSAVIVALIAIALVIGNSSLYVVAQGLQDKATTITDNLISNDLDLIETTSATTTSTNENSNQEDNEVVSSSTRIKATLGGNTRDQNILIGDTITPEPLTNNYLNVSRYPGEYCNRRCVSGMQRVCYFEFTLEYYQAMGV